MQSIRTAVRNGRQLPRQGAIVWYAVLGLSLASLVTMATWSYAEGETEPTEEGVRGILPYEVPEDLTEDSFASLDGNWTEWSAGVAQTLIKFYESESLDLAAQREIIADLKGKLKVMEASLADARYRQLHDPIGDLHGKLARRVKLAEAVLDTLALDPDAARTARLEASRKKVGRTLAELDAYLRKMNNGTGWLDFLETPEVQKFVDAKDLPKDVPAALTTTHRKLKAAGKLPEKTQREFLTRPPFKALEAAIAGYVDAASTEPADTTELRENLATLVDALERHELEQTSEAAAEARKAFGAVKSTAPDGGDLISDVLRSYYFNFNMKIVISEALLNRIVAEDRTHEGPVRDHILGANVYGNQTTNSRVGIDLRPNNSAARFDLTLNGTVQSSTQGVTDRATIYTSGHHQYWARKPITFDGLAFKLSEATIQVSANNTTTGASTGADGTLFSGIAKNVAVRTAREKRSQSEAIARQRVSSRVLPEFNKEVDNKFTTSNADFEKRVAAPLKELDVYPDAYTYRTTDTQMRVSTRLMAEGELGGSAPSSAITSAKGLVAHFHESLINNTLDRMNLAGRTMTEDELSEEMAQNISKLTGRKVEPRKAEREEGKEPTTFIFEKEDPIRVSIGAGELTLTLRAGLKQEGEDDIPAQVIVVPLTFTIDGDNIVVESGTLQVSAVERPKSLAKQIVRAGVVRKKIGSALPTRKIDRHRELKLGEGDTAKEVKLSISDIKTLNGWLSVVVE